MLRKAHVTLTILVTGQTLLVASLEASTAESKHMQTNTRLRFPHEHGVHHLVFPHINIRRW